MLYKDHAPGEHIVNAALGRAQHLLNDFAALLNEVGHGQTKAVHTGLVNLLVKKQKMQCQKTRHREHNMVQ